MPDYPKRPACSCPESCRHCDISAHEQCSNCTLGAYARDIAHAKKTRK